MKGRSPIEYVRPNIRALKPYSTARDEFKGGQISAWLDANESPYDNYTTGLADDVKLNRYPDPHQLLLREAIASIKGVCIDNVFLGGAGSDEAIDLIYRIFCEPRIDNVVAMSPTYGVYQVAADINDVEYREAHLHPDFTFDTQAILNACDAHTKVIWICSPNNPTGNAFDVTDILRIAEAHDGIVAVDEAYIDFSEKGSVLPYINEYPNIIVLQTMSKAHGMASMRLGMAFGNPDVMKYFAMTKYPYNVNGPTQRTALALIKHDISAQVKEILRQRKILERELCKFDFIKCVYKSDANFVLIKVDDANKLYDYLIDHGVIVRNRNKVIGCGGCLRITVGTPEENVRVINLLKQYK